MHFIGHTGNIQRTLEAKLARVREDIIARRPVAVRERRQLFTGPRGVGKTELAKQLAGQIAGHPLEVDYLNGQNVTIDLVRQWTADAQYRPLFGSVSVKFIDEIDAVGNAALNDLRTYLDTLPNHRVILAATNEPISKLQVQLQSRFQVWTFRPVPLEDIAAHLVRTFPALNLAKARDIAGNASGDVRAAEADAQSWLDVQAALPLAA